MSYSGKLIVIEGGDASGKATQTAELKKRLETEGKDAEFLDFPQYQENTVGALLRECLDGKRGDFMSVDSRVASVLYAADRFETKPKLEKWLNDGKIVLLDRYTTANMLHQGAKIAEKEKREETVQWIYHLEHEIFKLPLPDIVFYLSVPYTERQKLQERKGRKNDVAEEYQEHQKMVDERSESILNVYENTHKIDCMRDMQLRSIEDISDEIYNKTKQIL